MAKVQNIPGIFGQPTVSGRQAGTATRLGEIFGLEQRGFDPVEQQRILTASGQLGKDTTLEQLQEIQRQFGLDITEIDPDVGDRSRRTKLTGSIESTRKRLEGLTLETPSPSEQFGLAAAERLGGPSIFDQLGILDRAQELTQPVQLPTGFGGRTASEDALLQEIIGLTGGGSAARGLGAPSLGALGSQLAPALTQLRQQDIQNLFSQGQLGVQQLGALTGAGGLGVTERFGEVQGILDLAGLTLPQPVVSQSSGSGGGLGAAAGIVSSIIAACHVAEELFGIDDMRTHFARFYCATNDNPFIRAYRKMSRIWAKHLKDNPDKKHIVKPIWEAMALEGYKEYKRWQDGLHQ